MVVLKKRLRINKMIRNRPLETVNINRKFDGKKTRFDISIIRNN